MKNKLFSSFLIVTLGLFIFVNSLFAVGTGTTDTGLPYTLIGNGGVRVDRWVSYTLGTSNSYIYNNSGSSTPSDAGSFGIVKYRVKNLELDITGMSDAGTNTIGIFTSSGTTTIWSTSVEIVYSGTQSASFPISENSENIRIGAKRSGTSNANLTVRELYFP